MKIKFPAPLRALLITCLAWIAPLPAAPAKEPTALELIKEGNEYVGKDSKNKVVQLRSEKSVASLTPNIWYVVYFDPDARFKTTEVKFGAGKKLEVTRPLRMFERISGDDKRVLDPATLKVDSDEAIRIAAKEPLLDKLTLTNTALKLDRDDEGRPVWEVRLWAAKIRKPSDTADIGKVLINATDGKVVKTDLRLKRLD
jgi:hypothetical protein